MNKQTLLFLAFLGITSTTALTGCAGLLQSASVTEAYKHYNRENYDRTLEIIARAENAKPVAAELRAELTFLKAQTYEQLGQQEKAIGLYEYLIAEHQDSQYAYLAKKKLESSS